jgi:hypothetical protein
MTTGGLPVHPNILFAVRYRRRPGKATWHGFTPGFGESLCGLMYLRVGESCIPTPGPGQVCRKCTELAGHWQRSNRGII